MQQRYFLMVFLNDQGVQKSLYVALVEVSCCVKGKK